MFAFDSLSMVGWWNAERKRRSIYFLIYRTRSSRELNRALHACPRFAQYPPENMALRRALHFVFKVGDRSKTVTFYRDVLGMKVCITASFSLQTDN